MAVQTHPQLQTGRDTLLRRAMQADAVVTAVWALAIIAASSVIAPWLGVPPIALIVLGALVLVWDVLLWREAGRPTISRRFAWLSVVLGVIWVIDSVALLVTGWLPLTSAGWWLVTLSALAVAGFTEAQYIGLRRR